MSTDCACVPPACKAFFARFFAQKFCVREEEEEEEEVRSAGETDEVDRLVAGALFRTGRGGKEDA
jgi:hypothetical protein